MNTTKANTLTAVIDGAAAGAVYGVIAGTHVGVGNRLDLPLAAAMDSRIVAEGYIRIGDWTKRGPLDYVATIEAHPQRCQTCVDRCECDTGSTGCGHYGCWYADGDIANSCPGVAAVRIEKTGATR